MADALPEEPPGDPRDALIAVQAERIEALEAPVADLREQLAVPRFSNFCFSTA